MAMLSNIRCFLEKPVMRIYIYPFVLANIIVLILAFIFQHVIQLSFLFSFSAGIIYICMFWVMAKRHHQIKGKKISKVSLALLVILILLLCISFLAEAMLAYPTKEP